MNWETYQNAYINAPLQLRELLDSDHVPDCVKISLERRNALPLRKSAVVELSANVIGIQTIDETVKKLTEVGIPDALQFLAEVQTCINGHDIDIKQAQATPSPSEALQSEISAVEHDLETIKGIRTMAHDMQEAKVHPIQPAPIVETTYQSNQADILRPVAPAPVVNETPRWDTEG